MRLFFCFRFFSRKFHIIENLWCDIGTDKSLGVQSNGDTYELQSNGTSDE